MHRVRYDCVVTLGLFSSRVFHMSVSVYVVVPAAGGGGSNANQGTTAGLIINLCSFKFISPRLSSL
jgi:hypothetical protein